ncbi:hypothetical protein PGQ11_009251 [Apiospora arundinis]|uniref:Uncharacterized protein n=1 Tax=Apiospora arundinis TaxID=335852 RepID=A0ABR2II63_9PEZI
MSSTDTTLTAFQRGQIWALWNAELSRIVQSYLRASALRHWWKAAGIYDLDDNQDKFSPEISEKKVIVPGLRQIMPHDHQYYRGLYELRDIGREDTHATIAIATSWVVTTSKSALEDCVYEAMCKANIPEEFIRFIWVQCDPLLEIECNVSVSSSESEL